MDGFPELPALSEVQLEIMNIFWEREPCSIGEVWKILNARRGVARNTIQTLIVRLEEKGWLTHTDEGTGFLYRTTVPRDHVQQQMVKRVIETVFSGSAEDLVLTLLNGETVSAEEAHRIREMISKARKGKRS